MADDLRIRLGNSAPERPDRDFVLYWMIAARRTGWNYGLERAVECARELGKPLVVLEALRAGYRWASDRLHRFVLEGMRDNDAALARTPVLYYPYLEPHLDAGKGLLAALGARAALVVTDDYPCYFLPRMVARASELLDVRLELVDSNGLLPMRATDKAHPSAYAFRRHLQRELPPFLQRLPAADPLAGAASRSERGRTASLRPLASLPPEIERRWPRVPRAELERGVDLSALPIEHAVPPVAYSGGQRAARAALARFQDERLERYADDRNQPDEDGASGLSPYLHFGHVSPHEIFAALAERESWTPDDLADGASGAREGWWGMTPPAEAFLDQLVTWRELGFNRCSQRDDYDRYASLPDWAQATLEQHAVDPRPHVYTLEQFESARTHDELWNAAQRQLLCEGRIHNYLRMLWGKKILEWTATPREALDVMIALNDKHAVDGRDPNSYSGILWCLGRYDRPWGPEREIFGLVRYMSSQNTARKLRVKEYLRRWSAGSLFA